MSMIAQHREQTHPFGIEKMKCCSFSAHTGGMDHYRHYADEAKRSVARRSQCFNLKLVS